MNINKTVEVTPDVHSRFQSFIVFEVAAPRVSDNDILLMGEDVRDMFEDVSDAIGSDSSLKSITIQNRLSKIRQMLDLLQSHDGIILTKFFDKIWRRYSYISNLGENFIDLETLFELFPEKTSDIQELIAQRIDDSDDDVEESDDDSNDDDDTEDTENAESDDSEVVAEESEQETVNS